MYELIQVGVQTYYINCPAKIGIYRLNETDVWLIDSGNDKDAAKKVRKVLDGQGWQLKGIVNTHSHADHIGGNQHLQKQTGCVIYTPGIEADFTNHPVLESTFLYGGYSCKDLRHKFLCAQESYVSSLTDVNLPPELEIFPLPGHSFEMIGVRTPDDVVFLADCVSSAATLNKYQLTFLYDIAAQLETLDRVEQMKAAYFVPAHADTCTDMTELVQLNRQKILEIRDHILDLLAESMTFESLLQKLFHDYGLTMNFEQYVLIGSTVRSYLSWLKDSGLVTVSFEDNLLRWQKVDA